MEPTVLVLAGQRSGRVDPLAQARGISHKATIKVAGEAVIARVLRTIEQCLPQSRILVSIEDWDAIAREPLVAELHREGRLHHIKAMPTIDQSVVAAASDAGAFPLLITTADNALLSPAAVAQMVARGENYEGVIVALAPREAIERAHPGGKGRYYEFRDGAYSNCNLFWISSAQSLRAATAFRDGGQFLKVKGRMLRTFGLLNLALFLSRRLSLDQMFNRVSKRLGCRAIPLVLSDGRLAIDVDDERSFQMVEEILLRSKSTISAG
jgi:GTP:adenosylcobinamide-phosphate guanylyltransferase